MDKDQDYAKYLTYSWLEIRYIFSINHVLRLVGTVSITARCLNVAKAKNMAGALTEANMIQRIRRRFIIVAGSVMPLFMIVLFSSPVAAANYYSDYTLSPAVTNRNIDIAFVLITVGLTLLAIDSLLFIAHHVWLRRPRRRQAWSPDRL